MISDALVMRQSVASKGQAIDFSFSVDLSGPCIFGSSYFFFYFLFFRALKAGMQRPLLVCPPHKDYKNSSVVSALGALQALYMVKN